MASRGVQFRLDGQDLGAEDVSAPYSIAWNTTAGPNGAHTLAAVARDASGNSTTSASVAVTVQNQPAPQFVVDSPITVSTSPPRCSSRRRPDADSGANGHGARRAARREPGRRDAVSPARAPSVRPTSAARSASCSTPASRRTGSSTSCTRTRRCSTGSPASRLWATSPAASSERVIWQNDVSAAIYHQGGGLAFGADGNLYVSVGDNLNRDSAQDLTASTARSSGSGATAPCRPTIPSSMAPARTRTRSGRSGCATRSASPFDPTDGRDAIGDVGEGSWEEVDVGQRGANYGWPTCEGDCGEPGLVDPLFTYPHNGRDASITGGFVYHGGSSAATSRAATSTPTMPRT